MYCLAKALNILSAKMFSSYLNVSMHMSIYAAEWCLDHNDLNNYRPVSNLCFIAKILEKIVLSQVSSLPQLSQSLQYLSISISSMSQH